MAAREPPPGRFVLPDDYPPPRGVKLLMLSVTGAVYMGTWMGDDYAVAWSPMPECGEDVEAERDRRWELLVAASRRKMDAFGH